jgi:hypothetical protein
MEKKKNKLKWKDVESAIDNLNKEDLKIWISDLLYLPEELDKAREEEREKIIDRLRMLNSQWSKDFASKIYTKQDVFNHIENILSKLKE